MGILANENQGSEGERKISVIAQIKAKSEHEVEVRDLLAGLIGPSKAEPGCIDYEVMADIHTPGSFFTYEEWESEAALQEHLQVNKEGLDKLKTMLEGELKISVLRLIN